MDAQRWHDDYEWLLERSRPCDGQRSVDDRRHARRLQDDVEIAAREIRRQRDLERALADVDRVGKTHLLQGAQPQRVILADDHYFRRARVPREMEKGWTLYVADDDGRIAAMLALHLPDRYLDQLFVAPDYQGKGLGRQLLAFTREHLADEIRLRCVRENDKAWRWYEREGFVFEKQAVEQMTGFTMKYYRWKKQGAVR